MVLTAASCGRPSKFRRVKSIGWLRLPVRWLASCDRRRRRDARGWWLSLIAFISSPSPLPFGQPSRSLPWCPAGTSLFHETMTLPFLPWPLSTKNGHPVRLESPWWRRPQVRPTLSSWPHLRRAQETRLHAPQLLLYVIVRPHQQLLHRDSFTRRNLVGCPHHAMWGPSVLDFFPLTTLGHHMHRKLAWDFSTQV